MATDPLAGQGRSRAAFARGPSALRRFMLLRMASLSYPGTEAEQLLLAPQDLRTADPSFATEIYNGHFGLAGSLVEALRGKAELAPKPLRAAGFLVLKAPDIPSVLLELGHLSNTKDEHQMRDPAYRHRLAETLLQGIDGYFSTRAKKPERGAEAESVNR